MLAISVTWKMATCGKRYKSYVEGLCGACMWTSVGALESESAASIIRQIYLSSATLQFRFDFYLTLGHNMGVRVDKRNRLCTT